MQINDRIANLITFLELNPSAFAEKIGVKAPVVYNIIKGRRNKPSYDLLLKILEVYTTINTSWLLKGEGEMWVDQLPDEEQHAVNLDARITELIALVNVSHQNDPNIDELSELVKLLQEENRFHKDRMIDLYSKNERLMDLLRNKMGLNI
jgi:transcriptional regulator with XRE-family HTH domain